MGRSTKAAAAPGKGKMVVTGLPRKSDSKKAAQAPSKPDVEAELPPPSNPQESAAAAGDAEKPAEVGKNRLLRFCNFSEDKRRRRPRLHVGGARPRDPGTRMREARRRSPVAATTVKRHPDSPRRPRRRMREARTRMREARTRSPMASTTTTPLILMKLILLFLQVQSPQRPNPSAASKRLQSCKFRMRSAKSQTAMNQLPKAALTAGLIKGDSAESASKP